MKNQVLLNALAVTATASLENENAEQIVDQSVEINEEQEALIDQFAQEDQSAPVDADTYVEQREVVENDMAIMEGVASKLEAEAADGGQVTEVSMEAAVQTINGIVHRYGGQIDQASMEAMASDPAQLVARIRSFNASLESVMVASLEAYKVSDLWDRLGVLNREIPALKDNIAMMKNYVGKQGKVAILPFFGRSLVYAFRVNGSVAENIPKAASETASICTDLLKLGNDAIDAAKKAADIAIGVDWKDLEAAEKAIKQISSIRTPVNDIYKRFDETFTLNNRKLNVKKYDVKNASALGDFSKAASLNVSWPKIEWFDLVFHSAYVQIAQGSRKRNVKVEDMVDGLSKLVAPAEASKSIRAATPKKWQEHKTMATRLSKDVAGTAEAKAVARSIAELDRLGWQCVNGAFTIMATIIREINTVAERLTKDVRKQGA